jgi:SNF2 family DNA or RNA helicase
LKAHAVATYARQLLLTDPTMRMLVFAHHHSVLRRIAFDLRDVEPGVRLIDGETPEERRTEAIRDFQNRAMRLLVLGIGTAREGITLTAANRVLFAEASWTPAHNDQAVHRAARIGQTRPVVAEYLSVADTLDEAVMRTCTRKTRLLNELFA